jgi:pyruvate dehydrogenase E2 component (dihydrolipoamide acetyltransferase)
VGEPIIAIETGAPAPDAVSEDGAKIGEPGADGRIATLVGYGPRQGAVTRRPRHGRGGTAAVAGSGGARHAAAQTAPAAPAPAADRGAPAPAAVAQAAAQTAAEVDPADDRRLGAEDRADRGPALPDGDQRGSLVPLAKPPVRKLAKDLGVDLRALTGSGPGGVITREDVHAAATAPAVEPGPEEPAEPAATVGTAGQGTAGGVRREPIRGVRKATAAAMVQSAFTAPHVTEFLAVDVTETMALRDRLRTSRPFADVKLTPLAFVAKAVCLAARRTPAVNASWDEQAGEIVYYDRVQLGIAAATPRGLVVPKIRDADTLDLHGLAVALGELTATARAGKTAPADLVGGTITITNVGVFGVDTGTPILNPGEAAILAVGSIKPAPWVVDGQLAVRTVCRLALSFDHRLVDGEQGSRFLADVGALLEDPATAMLW